MARSILAVGFGGPNGRNARHAAGTATRSRRVGPIPWRSPAFDLRRLPLRRCRTNPPRPIRSERDRARHAEPRPANLATAKVRSLRCMMNAAEIGTGSDPKARSKCCATPKPRPRPLPNVGSGRLRSRTNRRSPAISSGPNAPKRTRSATRSCRAKPSTPISNAWAGGRRGLKIACPGLGRIRARERPRANGMNASR